MSVTAAHAHHVTTEGPDGEKIKAFIFVDEGDLGNHAMMECASEGTVSDPGNAYYKALFGVNENDNLSLTVFTRSSEDDEWEQKFTIDDDDVC